MWHFRWGGISGGNPSSATVPEKPHPPVWNSYLDSDDFLRAILDWTVIQDLTYCQVTSQDTRNVTTFD